MKHPRLRRGIIICRRSPPLPQPRPYTMHGGARSGGFAAGTLRGIPAGMPWGTQCAPNSRIRSCPALWHASVSGLGRALTGSGKPWPGARSTGQKPYTIPGALLRRQSRRAARRAGFGACGAKGQRPLPRRERSPAPPHKKIPRRALCLGKDLFCLLRLFFSPLFAGQFSPLPLRPC